MTIMGKLIFVVESSKSKGLESSKSSPGYGGKLKIRVWSIEHSHPQTHIPDTELGNTPGKASSERSESLG